MARVEYVGENATHEWLCFLAKQPGEVWIESRKGQMVIVHEFEDQRTEESRRLGNPIRLPEMLSDVVQDQNVADKTHELLGVDSKAVSTDSEED